VAVELIRNADVAGQYRDGVRIHLALRAVQLPVPSHGDPRDDLDRASPAIVKTLEGRHGDTYPEMTWEPKAAFTAIADCYGG
jgi:hypothetical protein